MESLEDKYTEIEKDYLAWIKEPAEIRKSHQYYRIWEVLVKLIRERSLADHLDPPIYQTRLSEAAGFLEGLKCTLVTHRRSENVENESDQVIWLHESSIDKLVRINRDSTRCFDENVLLNLAAHYLARPWMQLNEIDWILLDSLVYSEMMNYYQGMLSGTVFSKPNWAYIFAEGNIAKSIWIRLVMELGKLVLRYIVPPAIIATLYFQDYRTPTLVVGALYATYLAIHVALWPRRYLKRKKLRNEAEQAENNWQIMMQAYSLCSPPVINPIVLREQLSKPTSLGPPFSGAVYAMIDRIIARDQNVFLPFHPSPS